MALDGAGAGAHGESEVLLLQPDKQLAPVLSSRGSSDAANKTDMFEILLPTTLDPCGKLNSWWFTSPETWQVDHATPDILTRRRSPDDLSHAMATVFAWLAQWVDGEHNPFIHHQLYQHRFPQCMQDAYMTLSCYLNRKPGNERMVYKIVEEKAQQLVHEHKLHRALTKESLNGLASTLDPLAHLARVQALLLYQLIGLYDGNIRSRSVAEQHIPVLLEWMNQAVDCASKCDSLGLYMIAVRPSTSNTDSVPWETLAWYSWILAESLRRTSLLVSAILGMYLSTRDGVARCLGGMMFTSREGFWEAPSAQAWEAKCCKTYGGLVRLTETEKLLANVPAAELDEFARLVLKVTFGSEQMERWGLADRMRAA